MHATGTPVSVETFVAAGGTELGLVVHPALGNPRETVFLYLHGIESHAGWFADAAALLSAAGYAVYCLDRRGSGINREDRGHPSGHVPAKIDLLGDVHLAIQHVRKASAARSLVIVGLSWGGKYALASNIRYPGDADGLVLITPGIKPKVGLGFGEKLKVLRDAIFSPERQHPVPIEPDMFTTTPRVLDYITNDPLRLHTVSTAFLWQSRRMDKLLDRHGDASQAPVLLFLAGHDRIIDNEATRHFFARRQNLKIIDYPDQTHSIQLDAPDRLTRDIIVWVETTIR